MFLRIIKVALQAALYMFLAVIFLGALVSVRQEAKIWQNPKLPSLKPIGMLKVYLMNVLWMLVCAVGALLTPVYCLFAMTLDTRKWAHEIVERTCAKWICRIMIAPVEVKGMEHIPKEFCSKSPAPVFIANHDSQIDLAATYFIEREWRWIAKSSVKFLPGVGQVMWLGRHVLIDRAKSKSNGKTGARNLYVQSNESVQNGVPMFIFPQGTRRLGERLPFKDGAFKIAQENQTSLVPISLEIPLTAWNSSYPFKAAPPVKITVHPPLDTKGKDIETLKQEAFDIIYSVLPDYAKND